MKSLIPFLYRFSSSVDVLLPINFELALQVFLMVAFAVLTIIIVFPWFLIALLPVGIIFAAILKFYRKGVHDLKRLENIARSPWFSHISSTTLGLTTIHAYEKTDEFVTKWVTCRYLHGIEIRVLACSCGGMYFDKTLTERQKFQNSNCYVSGENINCKYSTESADTQMLYLWLVVS